MGDQTGTALWARFSLWKSALVIAPLAGAALFIATGTSAQTSGSTAPPNQPAASTTVAPKPAPDAARRGRGPKEKTKILVGRTAAPDTPADPATPAQTVSPVAPIDAPDAARRGGPKGGGRDKEDTGRTETPAPNDAPADERRKEGPKGDSGSDAQGRVSTTPAPDTQPAGRGTKPKGAVDHGRTATTPLIIGTLGTAAVLALVVSSGNDRPASP